MPHAVLLGAKACPELSHAPLATQGGTIHKVLEVAEGPQGWLLKSLIISGGAPTKFFARIDRRDDGLLVRLDDHMAVERTPIVFDHLALVAKRVLEANLGSTLGPTNLADRMG